MNSFETICNISLSDDIYCQLCEGLITKEEWIERLYSKRQSHKELNGF